MADIINLLPDSIANQIAAGEVVQRPASAVKEMLENAIDAGSTNIQLIIKDAGKSLIQIIDNGKGMSETDARMCFERHATSKIHQTEDLFNIHTFGFRGEAMASIASVAQVEMKTKQAEEELGTLIRIEGGELKVSEPAASPEGTSISVKNLFFNVPARRNFLKSKAVENRHIIEEFQRIALAHPDIHFSLVQDESETYNLPPAKLSQRVVSIFGKSYKQNLARCEEETDVVSISGYIGKPQAAKKTRGEQFFFVNNRFIKSSYLNHALSTAYEGLLADGTHPFYVLFLNIDPERIDVNVHPTKTEIKFEDERTIYAILKAAVKQALGIHNIAPSLDFDQDINFGIPSGFDSGASSDNNSSGGFSENTGKKPNWETIFEGFEEERHGGWEDEAMDLGQSLAKFDSLEEDVEPHQEEMFTVESAANDSTMRVESAINQSQSVERKGPREAFLVNNRYIATSTKTGLLLVDKKAAHERILFERYLDSSTARDACQQLLFPQVVELNPADSALLSSIEADIKGLGFMFDINDNGLLTIHGAPADVDLGTEQETFEELLEEFKNSGDISEEGRKEQLARTLAKRSLAHRSENPMTSEEMRSLIDKLFACHQPNYTPDGTPTFMLLDSEDIGSLFEAGL